MAHISVEATGVSAQGRTENGVFGALIERYRTWRAWSQAFRAARGELDMLSDRELADIGVARCDIYGIAVQTADAAVAKR